MFFRKLRKQLKALTLNLVEEATDEEKSEKISEIFGIDSAKFHNERVILDVFAIQEALKIAYNNPKDAEYVMDLFYKELYSYYSHSDFIDGVADDFLELIRSRMEIYGAIMSCSENPEYELIEFIDGMIENTHKEFIPWMQKYYKMMVKRYQKY